METEICKLTGFFEKPFWVGVFERVKDGKLSVSKVTFGKKIKLIKKGLTKPLFCNKV